MVSLHKLRNTTCPPPCRVKAGGADPVTNVKLYDLMKQVCQYPGGRQQAPHSTPSVCSPYPLTPSRLPFLSPPPQAKDLGVPKEVLGKVMGRSSGFGERIGSGGVHCDMQQS